MFNKEALELTGLSVLVAIVVFVVGYLVAALVDYLLNTGTEYKDIAGSDPKPESVQERGPTGPCVFCGCPTLEVMFKDMRVVGFNHPDITVLNMETRVCNFCNETEAVFPRLVFLQVLVDGLTDEEKKEPLKVMFDDNKWKIVKEST